MPNLVGYLTYSNLLCILLFHFVTVRRAVLHDLLVIHQHEMDVMDSVLHSNMCLMICALKYVHCITYIPSRVITPGCLQEDSQGLQQLCNILHILAYADICQQPWQDLRTSDCLHFIQLAQRGLEYMLRLASTAHSALVSLNLYTFGSLLPSRCKLPIVKMH